MEFTTPVNISTDKKAESISIFVTPHQPAPGKTESAKNYRLPPEGVTREGSWFDTASRNVEIVELVKGLEDEPATVEQQALLAQYTGFGAGDIRNKLFPTGHWQEDRWRELKERLQAVLGKEELAALKKSTQYAHYTPVWLVQEIWEALERFGFNGGQVLDPGMGNGLFAMCLPADVQATYTGIEMEPMTALVAQKLLPESNVLCADYTNQKLPDGFFDAVVGNPPYLNRPVTADPVYAKKRFSLHDYFFAKSMDKLKPGGLLAFLSSVFTLDKKDGKLRKWLTERADLLAAVRLPEGTFWENAGTKVVADVVFLRKRREGECGNGVEWLELAELE